MTTLPDDIADIIARHVAREAPLFPILRDVQAAFGAVDEAAVRAIAAALNLSRAEVHGVVSFYHDFESTADPCPVIKLCHAEACQARGARALIDHGAQVAAGRVALKPTYCLGLCSVGPAALVGEDVHARLDPARLTALIEAAR